MIKIMLIVIAVCWAVALILPVILKVCRSKKGDSSNEK